MILEYGQPKFNLMTRDPKVRENYAVYVANMLESTGWQIMKQIMEDNLKQLEEQIVSKIDEEGKMMEEEEVDLIRVQYAQIKQLLVKPQQLIDAFSGQPKIGIMPELDAYAKSKEGQQYAGTLSDDTT